MILDKNLYNTRPEECSYKENACYDALDKLGISFERAQHEHIGTIEGCLEINEVLGCKICKKLFLSLCLLLFQTANYGHRDYNN